MLVCGACGETYLEGRFCPQDGRELSPAAGGDPVVGTVLMDQFEIREEIGRGGMGAVYRAWQAPLRRDVAIKILHEKMAREPMLAKRFIREARAVAAISHPNVVPIYLVGTLPDERPYLIMEYVDGVSLESLCEDGPVSPRRALHIAAQLAAALADMHRTGVLHRDLKPENVLLVRRECVPETAKILDFGIAKFVETRGQARGQDSRLSRTGIVFGTPFYMAPEQASGDEVDARTDLYSLGVILYRMLSGRLPFVGEPIDVLVAHVSQAHPPLAELNPTLPEELVSVVHRCLEKDPERRYQTATELHGALSRVARRLSRAASERPRFARPASGSGETERSPGASDWGAIRWRPTEREASEPAFVDAVDADEQR